MALVVASKISSQALGARSKTYLSVFSSVNGIHGILGEQVPTLSLTATMRFSIKSTIFFALTATAAQADNFVASCDANSVKVSGRTLTANCRNISGGLQCSKLDLNRCIKNSYGSLQADPTGSGYDTHRQFRLVLVRTYMLIMFSHAQ